MRRNRTSGWRTAGSLGLLLAFVAGVAVLTPVAAQEPLFSFVQISDSQPNFTDEWLRLEKVLDVVVAAGAPGALLPRPIDFVLFAGDLVDTNIEPDWIAFRERIDERFQRLEEKLEKKIEDSARRTDARINELNHSVIELAQSVGRVEGRTEALAAVE